MRTRTVGTAVVAVVALGLLAAPAQAAPTTTNAPSADQDLAAWVNPYVGTKPGGQDLGTGGGAGNTFPGADVPFGMVQWSPDTVKFQHGGYYYDDTQLRGFSLTHLSGAGCSTYEDIPFLPYVGEITDSPAVNPGKYAAGFSHPHEQVSPGYYGVTLDSGAQVELTTTQRTGSARLHYPAGQTATLLVNVSGSVAGTDDAQVTIGRDSISGWAASGRFCGTDSHYRVYFHAVFDQPFASFGTWHNGAVTPGLATQSGGAPALVPQTGPKGRSRSIAPQDTTVSGAGSGAYVTFDPTKPVNVRVGLSFVSDAGAQRNLKAENGAGRAFDDVAEAARAAWNARLNQVKVTGGTDAQRTTFYTALYHALLQPNVFSDTDGSYPGFDGRIHTADKGHATYTNFSGWDVYRSETQLLALLAPHETSDIARSMVAYAQQGGSWDRWTVANDYTGVMNGDPYHIIVSTAYAFGARDFDANTALLLMLRGATQKTSGYEERPGLADYLAKGYVPNAAADTLEYTSADFAIAQLARRLGDSASHDTFMKRAQHWQNLYNPATGYLEPRNTDGSFSEPFNPANPSGYVEGNGAQYTWMVPYDLGGLVAALGGGAAVTSRLDDFFTKLNAGPHDPHAFLGNEPTLQTPWLYDYTGVPAKTQALVRRVQSELYNPTPAGLVGNDDLGEMSSWYVWSALGMYPIVPGRAELVLNSPLFDQAVITTGSGKTITINAPGAAANPYVTGLSVNGAASTRAWLPESFATGGGTLDYTLQSTPDSAWATAPADAPPSFPEGGATERGYLDPSRLVIPAGGTGTTQVGVQDLSGRGSTAHWTATPPAGITLTPSSGDLTAPAAAKVATAVTVSVAAGTAEGNYRIPVAYTAGDGSAVGGATLVVLVAQPGSLRAALNNVGTSPDDDQAVADFDGDGYSYSRNALTASGLPPGGTVSSDGLTYTWPSVPVGDQDNVTANGQTITVSAPAGATKLGLLGSAGNGKASGTLTVTYTDGTTQTVAVGFSDWALGGTANLPPSFDNRIVNTTGYRNSTGGTSQQLTVYLFATAPVALDPGRQLASITLPGDVTGGTFHVFAVATG